MGPPRRRARRSGTRRFGGTDWIVRIHMPTRTETLTGCLWGCAVGDAIGLPYEGLPPRRARRFACLPLQHRFVGRRGMVSDDTDHTVFVAQSLLRAAGDPGRFRAALAWRLRLWLLCLPAGIGFATLKSILRLWLGLRPSGVFSAGNGPAMRSAIIGAFFAADAAARRAHVEASTLLTHTDPLALSGALAVAEIAARLASGEWSVRPSPAGFGCCAACSLFPGRVVADGPVDSRLLRRCCAAVTGRRTLRLVQGSVRLRAAIRAVRHRGVASS